MMLRALVGVWGLRLELSGGLGNGVGVLDEFD